MSITPDLNKALPHNDIAEKALLGAMLVQNQYVSEVFSELRVDDFYRDAHQKIAAAILNLVFKENSLADIITVSSYLDNQKDLKFVGGHSVIAALVDDIPENLDIKEYIHLVKDRSSLRQIIKSSLGIVQKSVEPSADPVGLLAQIQEDIISIREHRIREKGFHSASELVPHTLELIQNIQKHGYGEGLKTGYDELDSITSGFQRGDLIIIAARPSMGKTALALNIAENLAIKEEKAVAFFSIEMSREQIMMRLLASNARVNMSAMRSGKFHLSDKEWNELRLSASRIKNTKIFIDDSPSLSILEIKTRSRMLKNDNNIDIVFIDYLQLVKLAGEYLRKNDSRAQEVALITAGLKELAKELNIPVVALAQLNRSPETRGMKKERGPKYLLSDLKESGAIEQDADVVLFLHREEQYDRDTEKKGVAELIVAKQRNGPIGKIALAFLDKYAKFANLEYRDADYYE